MTNNIINLSAIASIAMSIFVSNASAGLVDFEDVQLASSFMPTSTTNGEDIWSSSGANFTLTSSYNGYAWQGFKASKATDTSDKTFNNDCCSVMGGGSSSSQYGVLYVMSFMSDHNSFLFDDIVNVESIDITNTAYTYNSLSLGDGASSSLASLDGPAYFNINFRAITGSDGNGEYIYSDTISFSLGSKDSNGTINIVDSWETISLESLNGKSGIYGLDMFFTYSDNLTGTYGINTPTYVAIDNIAYNSVPEPSTCAALVGILIFCFTAYKRRK